MDTHTCKNCGAIEDLKTGQLTYKGDNPLLRKVEDLQKEIFVLKQKNSGLSALLSEKNRKKKEGSNAKKNKSAGEAMPKGDINGEGFGFF